MVMRDTETYRLIGNVEEVCVKLTACGEWTEKIRVKIMEQGFRMTG